MESKYVSSQFFSILSHEIRRDILSLIHDKVEVSYSEILSTLNLEDGLLNFHLRKMKPLLNVTDDGTYVLSEDGKLAYAMLSTAEARVQSQRVRPAGLGSNPRIDAKIVLKRVLAFLIDFLLIFVFTATFLDEHFWQFISSTMALRIGYMDFLNLGYDIYHNHAHLFFIGYAIFTLLEAYSGQTLGKYLLNIRVVKLGGRRITLMDAAIRNLGKVFLLPLDLLVGVFFYSRGYIKFFDYYVKAAVEEAAATVS